MSNISDLINSSPYTLSNKMNQELGKFIKNSGFDSNSKCLDVVLANSKKSISSYFKKVGDFNWRKASNPVFFPEKKIDYRDYSKKCPEGWEETGNGDFCASRTYKGPCNSGKEKCKDEYVNSGRKKTEFYTENISQPVYQPSSNFRTYNSAQKADWARSCGVSWSGRRRLANCPDGWTDLGGGACRAPYWYWGPCAQVSGFNGYDDNAKRDWANYCVGGRWTNTVMEDITTDCPDGWTKQADGGCCGPESYRGPCNSCKNIGTRQVPVQKSREVPIFEWKRSCERESGTSFAGYNNWKKEEWERECGANWPMARRIEESYWTCNYGESIEDDMNNSNVIMIGTAKELRDAVMLVLGNDKVAKPRFFAISDGKVYVAKNGEGNIFVDKGKYEKNCEKENRTVELFEIDNELFDKLKDCKEMNDMINNFNVGMEGFENMGGISGNNYGYIVLFMLIILFLLFCYYFR